jgi:hypothetical protein
MKKIQNIISKIETIAEANKNGFSIDLQFKPITEGYIVATKHTQNSFGREGLTKVVALAFWQSIEKFDGIGGWFNEDNKQFYFDAIKVFTDKSEAEKFAIENEQIAYFDLYTGKEVRL